MYIVDTIYEITANYKHTKNSCKVDFQMPCAGCFDRVVQNLHIKYLKMWNIGVYSENWFESSIKHESFAAYDQQYSFI